MPPNNLRPGWNLLRCATAVKELKPVHRLNEFFFSTRRLACSDAYSYRSLMISIYNSSPAIVRANLIIRGVRAAIIYLK